MKSYLNHIQVNINSSNLPFYKELMVFLGWDAIVDTPEMAGYGSHEKGSIWFLKRSKEIDNDYDGTGVNHIGISVPSVEDVDKVVSFLKEKNISPLFDTPRHRPEFAGEKGDYYQVMFTSPDNVLFEILFAEFK